MSKDEELNSHLQSEKIYDRRKMHPAKLICYMFMIRPENPNNNSWLIDDSISYKIGSIIEYLPTRPSAQ